jgi:L-fuculose-phosphate aldolase
LVDTLPAAEIADLAHSLFRLGYVDPTGRIAARQGDGSLLLTPIGRSWDEITTADLIHVEADGRLISGDRSGMSPGLTPHLAVHSAYERAAITVHNHPFWSTLWAIRGDVPAAYDHEAARVGDIQLCDDADSMLGTTSEPFAEIVDAAARADALLLRNHGVMLIAESADRAYCTARFLERRAHVAWLCRDEQPLRSDVAQHIQASFASFIAPLGLLASDNRRVHRG